MTLEATFLKQIESEPEIALHRLIYADWLEERGDPRAELLRIQEQLRSLDVPDRPRVEARMHGLLNEGVQPLTITRTNSVGGELVLIFPGSFRMGSPPDEEDRVEHEDQVEVTLTKAFWMGRTVVTQREWREVMGTNPWKEKNWVKEGERFPATYVRWEDADEFCEKLTAKDQSAGLLASGWEYCLPVEAEWEYTCRAGTSTRFSFGDDVSLLGEYAWYDENTWHCEKQYAHEVGKKRPNPWELSDLHGNVWEWCAESLRGGVDPETLEEPTSRVCRGGSWEPDSRGCRSALRSGDNRGSGSDVMGFRLTLQQATR